MASDSDSGRHAAMANKIVQRAYVEAEYSRLNHLNAKEIESFLRAYDYTSRLKVKDHLEVMRLSDCIADELFDVILEYNREVWMEAGLEVHHLSRLGSPATWH